MKTKTHEGRRNPIIIIRKIVSAIFLTTMIVIGSALDGIAETENILATIGACLAFLGCLIGVALVYPTDDKDLID